MKKYIIIMSIILGFGILFACLTCTYFDPWEAAGIIGDGYGPIAFWIDPHGTVFKGDLYDSNDTKEIYYFGEYDQRPPHCIIAIPEDNRIYWSANNMGEGEIYSINYDGGDFSVVQGNHDSLIDSMAYDSRNNTLYFTKGTQIYKSENRGYATPLSIWNHDNVGMYITDIALDIPGNRLYYVDNTMQLYKINFSEPYEYQEVVVDNTDSPFLFKIAIGHNRIIWAGDDARIAAFDLPNNTGNTEILTDKGFWVKDLIVDPFDNYVYWMDEGGTDPAPPHSILKVNIYGANQSREEIRLLPHQDEFDKNVVFTVDFGH